MSEPFFPLSEAAACVNHDEGPVVFSVRSRVCPACGSESFYLIAKYAVDHVRVGLGGATTPIRHVEFGAGEVGTLVQGKLRDEVDRRAKP